MTSEALLSFLMKIEKLKCNTRHSWTSTGRRESVAEHSWRLAVLSMLVGDQLPGVDMEKVLTMCLIHDFGEAVTGDIPSFLKTQENDRTELLAVRDLLSGLPKEPGESWRALFDEMAELKTPEAKVFKALDKMEAVISHNEAPLETWLPLERELNLTYGEEEASEFPFLRQLREAIRRTTAQKTAENPEEN
ncbi:HD domain-containing protein [Papillibacter cinnamivorans]|uniref:5'-deoxynucleotidase n=1 Tax=Papillibacter cinnamivorans DSM 12816 TaxID=1122930 RepID=A0A1W1Z2Z2_9FIRM|nr:HD domain-containing protein [Papillibacter cinnamivorans]SMC42318.1 putative hydrolases of HD superfamily [Papillibacter cinnamivorans DSM 12816]